MFIMFKRKSENKLNTPVAFGNLKWQKVLRPIFMVLALGLWIAAIVLQEKRVLLCLASLLLSCPEIVWCAVTEAKTRKSAGYILGVLGIVIGFSAGAHLSVTAAGMILSGGYWLCKVAVGAACKDKEFFESLQYLRARVRENNIYVFRDAATLAAGTVIEVFPGETVPADGVLISEEEAVVDYSSWMHQQRNVQLSEGSVVYCGALNHGKHLTIRVTASGKFTLLQKMYAGIHNTLSQKSTIQTVMSKVVPLITAAFVLTALIVGIFVPLFNGNDWAKALTSCAGLLLLSGMWDMLGSIDLAFSVGITAMCRRGVLFKSCRQIMLLRHITDIIFSKTGTLTERTMRVKEIVPHNDYTKEQVLRYAAAAQQISKHLVASAILREAGDMPLPYPTHQLEIAGEGVCVEVDDKRVFVGNERLMQRAGVDVLPYHGLGIVSFVAVENTYVGCVILNDALKSGAAQAIAGLFSLGIRSIDLISGDKSNNVEAAGAVLGIHRCFAGLNKKEKADVVKRNVRKGKYGGKIAFVGDESDADCLAAADISFAMKTVEDNITGTAGDVAVISDDPMGVFQSFCLSYKLKRIFTVLMIFTLTVKLAMLALLCAGLLPIWLVALVESVSRLCGIYLAANCRQLSK